MLVAQIMQKIDYYDIMPGMKNILLKEGHGS